MSCDPVRFSITDARFVRAQKLFETHRPEEARAILRDLLREHARHAGIRGGRQARPTRLKNEVIRGVG